MIFLKKLNLKKDITKVYQKWLNDKNIQKYTEQKYKKHTINNIKKFVKTKNNSKNEFLFGIFLKKPPQKHIGNIKLGPINYRHKNAEISYFIGEKNLWGKGYASCAIKKIILIAKKKGIKKIKAGTYQINKSSIKLLKKNGFKIEGKFKSELILNKKRYTKLVFSLIL